MSLKEQSIGKGTIAYAGESAEYWMTKTARLRRGRAVITAVVAVVALLQLGWLVSPLGPRSETAQVLGSRLVATAPGNSTVEVALPDGTHATYTSDEIPVVGAQVTVTRFADGHLIGGTDIVVSLWLLAVVLAAVAAGRGIWQYRRRHVTTILR